MARSESRSEVDVGGYSHGYRGAITGSGDGKVGYGVDIFLLIELSCVFLLQEIGGVELSSGGGALRFAPFVVSCCEEIFEANPSFLLCGQTFLGFAVVYKETGLVDELKSDTNDLFEAVGSVAGGDIITAVFDPVEEGFSWLIDVVRGAEDSVVFL